MSFCGSVSTLHPAQVYPQVQVFSQNEQVSLMSTPFPTGAQVKSPVSPSGRDSETPCAVAVTVQRFEVQSQGAIAAVAADPNSQRLFTRLQIGHISSCHRHAHRNARVGNAFHVLKLRQIDRVCRRYPWRNVGDPAFTSRGAHRNRIGLVSDRVCSQCNRAVCGG